MRLRVPAHSLLVACLLSAWQVAAAGETLTFDQPELAGLSGFRVMWDEAVPLAEDGAITYSDDEIKDKHPTAVWAPADRGDRPGAIAFDALHRSMLVRFPGAAERIAAKLGEGYAIRKVELAIPFRDNELWPPHGEDFWDPQSGGYNARRNWGVDGMYRNDQPEWHAVAWVLRRAWSSEVPALAPTYNAYLGGVGYWAKFGATDPEHDRFPQRFGPTEVSGRSPHGRMDVTAVVEDAAFGATPGERLRALCDQGFVVQKWETYDHRYFNGVYEWATATGGRGILVRTPKLLVTLEKTGAKTNVSLPPTINLAQLAERLRASGQGGRPTAALLSPEQLDRFNRKMLQKPEWMPDWQFRRIEELRNLKGLGREDREELPDPMFFDIFLSNHVIRNLYGIRTRIDGKSVSLPAPAYERYKAWVDQILSRQPRGWHGFEAAKEMAQYYTYGESLPGPARQAVETCWTAWLMPDRPTADPKHHRDPDYVEGPLVHPMADQLAERKGTERSVRDTYWEKTRDWRGNKSFYRSGFNYSISTQNFNTTASAGALLGGAIIGEPLPMEDGRRGFRDYPLGLWAWNNGSCQEHIDHYYFSITMSGNKAVFDFGPTAYDRMLGRSVTAYGVEELLGSFHPELRRFIAPSSRTSLMHLLVATDGIQHVLHTLSQRGALFDFSKPQHVPAGMAMVGQEVPPEIVALQSAAQPWAPEWVGNLLDRRQFPFQATHQHGDRWRRAYMGRHYGLASIDLAMPRIQAMAQWRRADETVDQTTDLGTLDVRFGFNDTRFANDAPGWIGRSGATAVMQHKSKMLVLSSPFPYWNGPNGVGLPGSGKAEEITSLQTAIALFSYEQPEPTWSIFIDGKPVGALPATAKQGQHITLRDGMTYLGIVPLAASDFGRDVEVCIRAGETQLFGQEEVRPALVVESFNFRRDAPLRHGRDDFKAIDAGYGGFVIELSDASEHPRFEEFQRHMADARLEQSFDSEANVHRVAYRSGDDRIEAACPTVHENETRAEIPAAAFVRQVNDAWPYPAAGIKRDTDTSQAGVAGRLEKGGAILLHREGADAYLQYEPVSGTYRAMIPTFAASTFDLSLPGGLRLHTDGAVSLFEVVVQQQGRKIEVFHEPDSRTPPGEEKTAGELRIEGGAGEPTVILGGKTVRPRRVALGERHAWIVSLQP